ncbi:MAG TPA: protein kinase [Propionicimonas sp.]|uniref:protein kinase domain-containing protein n=1 Tax=Propionicimonas sp. TaxID=1955623 RepID=UPI002F427B9E
MTSDPTGPLGTLFGGRYRLRGLLGVGGSAAVYAADDLEQQTADGPLTVAVKILHPHLCATEEARAAFLREAHRAGELRHPNIVAVRACGVHDAGGMAMAWIALDFVGGSTLAEWVEAAGPLPPVAAAQVVCGVLAGLAEAHRAGLVHRDVSPRNVILERAGEPRATSLEPEMARILDFGLSDLPGRTTVGTDVLLSGGDDVGAPGVVGNPDFISPEQARGRAVSAAGDLYQAGSLLYFLLTGQAPYPRATAAQVLEAHISAPPPVPSALVPAARPLDRIVTRAMAKEPEDRFPDAAAFAGALEAALARIALTQLRSGIAATYQPTRVMAAARPELPGSAHAQQHGVPAGQRSLEVSPRRPAAGATGRVTPEPPRNAAAIVAVVSVVGIAFIAVVSTFAAPALSAHPLMSASPPASEPSTSTPTPTPTPTRASPPANVTVPTLHGSLGAAERTLRGAGLNLGRVTESLSPKPEGTVLGQAPDAGQIVPRRSRVALQVASGSNAVPATAGVSAAAAMAALESAGFRAASDRAVLDPTTTVLRSEPAEGVVLRLGVTVTLILVGDTPPSPTPTPTVSAP